MAFWFCVDSSRLPFTRTSKTRPDIVRPTEFGLSTPRSKSRSMAEAERGRARATCGCRFRNEYVGLTIFRVFARVLQPDIVSVTAARARQKAVSRAAGKRERFM